jgi:hypothetical protein
MGVFDDDGADETAAAAVGKTRPTMPLFKYDDRD